MPGPAPKRNARRRNLRPDWRTLPSEGFDGALPEWPLSEPDVQDLALWVELWRTPQADAWNDLGWTRVVARYARLLIEQENGATNAALLAEIRQLEDRLGLSPMAMKRLQWEVGSREAPAPEADGNVVNLFG